MNSPIRRLVVATAVYVGALCLFGPLTYLLVVRATEIVAGLVGVDAPLTGILGGVVIVGALAIALTVVYEIAAVQLHGVGAFHRGSPRRRFGRNLLLSATALAAGLAITEFAIGTFQQGIERGQVITIGLSLAVVAGLAWTLVRAVRSFRRGFRRTG